MYLKMVFFQNGFEKVLFLFKVCFSDVGIYLSKNFYFFERVEDRGFCFYQFYKKVLRICIFIFFVVWNNVFRQGGESQFSFCEFELRENFNYFRGI